MYQGVHLHSFQSLCCHDALASDQISLFLHLSQLVFHLDGIVCLVSHALTKISLLFSHLCKYIKKKKPQLGLCCTSVSALGSFLAILGEKNQSLPPLCFFCNKVCIYNFYNYTLLQLCICVYFSTIFGTIYRQIIYCLYMYFQCLAQCQLQQEKNSEFNSIHYNEFN